MKIVYLESARNDFLWMRQYYEQAFPAGRQKAQKQFYAIERILLENPFIGYRTHHHDVRELKISKTPFAIIYRPFPNRIEVLRIWDERQNR